MTKTIKHLLLGATILSAPIFTASAALAQSANSADTSVDKDGFSLEEIVVTSRRRTESLQNVPISVTAIQGDLLKEMGVTDLTDITAIAPNTTFSTTGTVSGSSSAAVVYIRGVGQNDYTPVTDPGVGIYVDDVYLGRTIGTVLDLMDIKSVEVIRGPQGTLFGRNTIGGAISIQTNDAEDDFGGSLRVVTGDDDRIEVFGKLSMPISDKVRAVANVMRRKRDGYVERVNVPGSQNLGNDNSTGARLKLDIEASEKLSFQLAADYVREREESAPEQNLFFRNGIERGIGQADRLVPRLWNVGFGTSTAVGCNLAANTNPSPAGGVNCYDESLNLGPFKTGETSLSQNDIDTWGVSLNSNYDINDELSVKLILAYRNLEARLARQVDGSPFNIFENREGYDQNQFSADLRFSGSTEKMDWVGGVFYFEEEADNQLDFGGVANGILWPVHFGGLVNNTNYAFYGESTFHVTDRFDISAGLRYTNETKEATPNAFSYPGGDIDNPPEGPGAIRDVVTNPTRLIDQVLNKNSFDKLTFRVNAAYQVTEETNLYGTVSTGFKSGGFEWRVTNPNFYNTVLFDNDGDGDGDLPQFAPETVTSYEIGLKTQIPDAGLRMNFAAFYSDYKDIQIAANPPGSIATFQDNAGQGRIQGFEIETTWVPTAQFLLNVGIGYTDAKYTQLNEGTTVSLDDNFILTPKWSVSWGASYILEMDSGATLTPRVDGVYKSRTDFEAQNSDYVFDDGYIALNASIRYEEPDQAWSIIAGIENLTDELYITGGDANTAIGYENGIYARPRNWYLALEYKW